MASPSAVWLYFEKSADGKTVKCSKCTRVLIFNKSTTTLANHLKVAHNIDIPKLAGKKRSLDNTDPDEPDVARKQAKTTSTPDTNTSADSTPSAGTSQKALNSEDDSRGSFVAAGPMDKCLNTAKSFSSGGARDAEVFDSLLFMIAKDCMPFATTEREGFRVFVKALQPLYRIPSEPTVTKKLKLKYEVLKNCVKSQISKSEFVCFMTDIWTHKNTMSSYLGVTTHYLDGPNFRSVEIGAIGMKERKTKENLKRALRAVCDDWGIEDERISGAVSDGGKNIANAIKEEFGADKHVTCIAHTANLIGQAAIGIHSYKVLSDEDDRAPMEQGDEEEEDREAERESGDFLRKNVKKTKNIVTFFIQAQSPLNFSVSCKNKQENSPMNV